MSEKSRSTVTHRKPDPMEVANEILSVLIKCSHVDALWALKIAEGMVRTSLTAPEHIRTAPDASPSSRRPE